MKLIIWLAILGIILVNFQSSYLGLRIQEIFHLRVHEGLADKLITMMLKHPAIIGFYILGKSNIHNAVGILNWIPNVLQDIEKYRLLVCQGVSTCRKVVFHIRIAF